ncbi:MAG TPA: hypothetical protein EYN88_06125 [Candidatus Poseidoniales archaeon]|nr:hypothetical protein [Candidatus Poseidoniales archaeon]
MKVRSLILALLLTTVILPFTTPGSEISVSEDGILYKLDNPPEIALEKFRNTQMAGARAPCPAIQNDGGTAGDAGNTTATARQLGTDPTTQKNGCVDANDKEDWYGFSMSSGYNIDVELSVPIGADFDLWLLNETGTGYYAYSFFNDPLEKITSIGTGAESRAGDYFIVVQQYSGDGNYGLQTWTNYTEMCADWYSPQDDGGSGQDAPANWSDSPTNFGNNITASYDGCMDKDDQNDVFAFDVPTNHTIEAVLEMDSGVDFDLYLHQTNGSILDLSGFGGDVNESVSSKNTAKEGENGTYYLNVSHWSGNANYTLYVFTNYSIPAPNLEITDHSQPTSAQPGDSPSLTVTVNNTGTLDTNRSFTVSAYLSVDGIQSWPDALLGLTTVNSLVMNTSQVVTINAMIPADTIEGEYNVLYFVDEEDVIVEKNEDDNDYTPTSALNIGTAQTTCPASQDDGGSGADAGDSAGTAVDLGTDIEQEFRGCVDSSDEKDVYQVTVSAGMPLNATLVIAPNSGADFDLRLVAPNGTVIDSSLLSGVNDDFVTTEDTDSHLVAGTYTLNVSYFGGFGSAPGGTYRLIIGQPLAGTWIPPFSCEGLDDMGVGGDASDEGANPTALGVNPNSNGSGCLDGNDVADAYQFSVNNLQNLNITIAQPEMTDFSYSISRINGPSDMNDAWLDNGDGTMSWTTMGQMYEEGMNRTYTLMLGSNNSVGNYSLSVMTTEPAPTDLYAESVNCPLDLISGEQAVVSWMIRNLAGPTTVPFSWQINLVNSSGAITHTLLEKNITFTGAYGILLSSSSEYVEIPMDTPSDNYTCVLSVDTNDDYAEANESNNNLSGASFYVESYYDFWANDIDQDGVNTTDTGDGIVDSCPEEWGSSTADVFGCQDFDGDGYSDPDVAAGRPAHPEGMADAFPDDGTQWADTDNDTFGDNPDGLDFDRCPNEPGVYNGEGGMGCPLAPVDSDGDGIFDDLDDCPDSAVGAVVNMTTGCVDQVEEPDTGDGGTDGTENGGGGGTSGSDGTDGTDGSGDGTGTGGNGDDSTSTTDSTSAGESLIKQPWVLISAAGAVLVILILTFLLMGGRGGSAAKDDAFVNAAFNAQAGMAGLGVSPQQLAYEQQLIAQGYPPETARQYAEHYFGQP